jgi:hypothetical protein
VSGCLSCRRRRKKCDERKSTCLACKRNFLICGLPDARRDSKPSGLPQIGQHETDSTTTGNSSVCSSLPSQCLIGNWTISKSTSLDSEGKTPYNVLYKPLRNQVLEHLCPQSRVLLGHYFHRTTTIMSPNRGETNYFIEQFMRIAMSHDMVL